MADRGINLIITQVIHPSSFTKWNCYYNMSWEGKLWDYIFREVKEGCGAWSETPQSVSHSFRYQLDINNKEGNNALGSENGIDKDPGVGKSAKNLQLIGP